MARQEHDYFRDLTYSQWHRSLEPPWRNELPYVDIDAVEICSSCRGPLALFEIARDSGQAFKPAGVTVRLAQRARLPAYLVFYRVDESGSIVGFRLRQLAPRGGPWRELSPEQYRAFLVGLRRAHRCEASAYVSHYRLAASPAY